MGGKSEQSSVSKEKQAAGSRASSEATKILNRGTSEIHQGSRLVDEDPNIGLSRERQLDLANGQLQDLATQQGSAFGGLLGAGDVNDPLVQRQITELSKSVGENFGRNVLPQIDQGATASGQFGSSRQGVAQGLAAGEAASAISRGATSALLGGQQVALQAQGLAPSVQQSLLAPSNVQRDLGLDLQGRSQQELFDNIQQKEAGRNAALQRVSQFNDLLVGNPLFATGISEQQGGQGPSRVQGAIGGAAAGSAAGPYGAIIGAILGGITAG